MSRAPLLAALGAVTLSACSVGLPDSLEGYRSQKGQEGRPDAPASLTGTPTGTGFDGGSLVLDAGPSDAPVVLPDVPLACPPSLPGNFSLRPWAAPTGIHRQLCSASQATQLVDCLLTTVGATGACDNFMFSSQNSNCIQCGVTSISANRRGPILDDGVGYFTNPPGCIAALSGDATSTGCAATFDALLQCEDAACRQCQSEVDWNACIEAADQGVCKTYAAGATCSQIYEAQCMGKSLVEEAVKLVKLFCGN